MREIKTAEYTCGIGAVIVGLGLYSYYVRELLASLLLFSLAFLCFGLALAGIVFIWSASEKLAMWTVPASRNVIAFSRRLIAAYARP
jgi:FtsH-binding integral membrane protein